VKTGKGSSKRKKPFDDQNIPTMIKNVLLLLLTLATPTLSRRTTANSLLRGTTTDATTPLHHQHQHIIDTAAASLLQQSNDPEEDEEDEDSPEVQKRMMNEVEEEEDQREEENQEQEDDAAEKNNEEAEPRAQEAEGKTNDASGNDAIEEEENAEDDNDNDDDDDDDDANPDEEGSDVDDIIDADSTSTDTNDDEAEHSNETPMEVALSYDQGEGQVVAINMTDDMIAKQAEIDRLHAQILVVSKLINLFTADATEFRSMLHSGDAQQLKEMESEIVALRSEVAIEKNKNVEAMKTTQHLKEDMGQDQEKENTAMAQRDKAIESLTKDKDTLVATNKKEMANEASLKKKVGEAMEQKHTEEVENEAALKDARAKVAAIKRASMEKDTTVHNLEQELQSLTNSDQQLQINDKGMQNKYENIVAGLKSQDEATAQKMMALEAQLAALNTTKASVPSNGDDSEMEGPDDATASSDAPLDEIEQLKKQQAELMAKPLVDPEAEDDSDEEVEEASAMEASGAADGAGASGAADGAGASGAEAGGASGAEAAGASGAEASGAAVAASSGPAAGSGPEGEATADAAASGPAEPATDADASGAAAATL